MPGPLILREPTYKGREPRFMFFIVKPSLVPSPKRRFHGEVEKAAKRAGLESNALDNLSVVGAWLIF
jgi:hypothetical protein